MGRDTRVPRINQNGWNLVLRKLTTLQYEVGQRRLVVLGMRILFVQGDEFLNDGRCARQQRPSRASSFG